MIRLDTLTFADDDAGDNVSGILFSPKGSVYVIVRVPSPDTYGTDDDDKEYLYALALTSATTPADKVTVTPFVTGPTMERITDLRELTPARHAPNTNYGAY